MKLPALPKLNAIGYFVVIILLLAIFWEAYKLLGAPGGAFLRGTVPVQAEDGKAVGALCGSIGLCELKLPVRADDRAMPHVWDILQTIFQPPRRGSDTILLTILLQASLFTLQEAVAGFPYRWIIGLRPWRHLRSLGAAGAGSAALCGGVADSPSAGDCADGGHLVGRQLVLRGGDRRLSYFFPRNDQHAAGSAVAGAYRC